MSAVALYTPEASPELTQLLDLGGHIWKRIVTENDVIDLEPEEGWAGAIIQLGEDPERGWTIIRALRKKDVPAEPVMLLIKGNQLHELQLRDELFDDFCLDPFHPKELEARLIHLFASELDKGVPDLIEYGPLAINLETYEALVEGQPLDLTYMEYELLRFLAVAPGRVFTREILLNRVWGYEYYGGARTVDVHVRRLRAKLGEENANLIQTVRSVGYRFGKSRWQ